MTVIKDREEYSPGSVLQAQHLYSIQNSKSSLSFNFAKMYFAAVVVGDHLMTIKVPQPSPQPLSGLIDLACLSAAAAADFLPWRWWMSSSAQSPPVIHLFGEDGDGHLLRVVKR